MISKIVLLFLVGMAVLAMFGRLRLPGRNFIKTKKCAKCGRFRIGRGACLCEEK